MKRPARRLYLFGGIGVLLVTLALGAVARSQPAASSPAPGALPLPDRWEPLELAPGKSAQVSRIANPAAGCFASSYRHNARKDTTLSRVLAGFEKTLQLGEANTELLRSEDDLVVLSLRTDEHQGLLKLEHLREGQALVTMKACYWNSREVEYCRQQCEELLAISTNTP